MGTDYGVLLLSRLLGFFLSWFYLPMFSTIQVALFYCAFRSILEYGVLHRTRWTLQEGAVLSAKTSALGTGVVCLSIFCIAAKSISVYELEPIWALLRAGCCILIMPAIDTCVMWIWLRRFPGLKIFLRCLQVQVLSSLIFGAFGITPLLCITNRIWVVIPFSR